MSDTGESIDELMVHTSQLNERLAEMGWPLITLPQRSAPIKPFFDDLIGTLVLVQDILRVQS